MIKLTNRLMALGVAVGMVKYGSFSHVSGFLGGEGFRQQASLGGKTRNLHTNSCKIHMVYKSKYQIN